MQASRGPLTSVSLAYLRSDGAILEHERLSNVALWLTDDAARRYSEKHAGPHEGWARRHARSEWSLSGAGTTSGTLDPASWVRPSDDLTADRPRHSVLA